MSALGFLRGVSRRGLGAPPLPGDLVRGAAAEAYAHAHGWALAARYETGPNAGSPYKFTKPNRLDVIQADRGSWYLNHGPSTVFSTGVEAMAAADARGSAAEVPWDHPAPVSAEPAPWPAAGRPFQDRHRSHFLVDWVLVGKLAAGDRILFGPNVERVLAVGSPRARATYPVGWLQVTNHPGGKVWPLTQQFLRLRRQSG